MTKTLFDMATFVPKRFHNASGKPFRTQAHFSAFGAKHNASKGRALAVLYSHNINHGHQLGLRTRELADQSGVSYLYLKGQLSRWVKWQYLVKAPGEHKGRLCWHYSLASKGKMLVELLIPADRLQKYIDEIKASRKAVPSG